MPIIPVQHATAKRTGTYPQQHGTTYVEDAQTYSSVHRTNRAGTVTIVTTIATTATVTTTTVTTVIVTAMETVTTMEIVKATVTITATLIYLAY